MSVTLDTVEAPPQTIHVKPNDTVQIHNLDLKTTKIDLIGPDLIIADLTTGNKLIIPGVGLYMFSLTEAPIFVFDSHVVSQDELLGKIGYVVNITDKDYITYTSLALNQHEKMPALPQPEISDNNKDVLLQMMAMVKPEIADEPLSSSPNEPIEDPFKAREELISNSVGQPSLPAVSGSPPVQASQTIKTLSARATFDFDVRILQVQSTDDTSGPVRTFNGGGGSSASFFSPSNFVQFSTEIIDTVSDPNPVVIYADSPVNFSSTLMSRVLQLSPNLPDGFNVTSVTISGFPVGFTVLGATGGGGTYTLTNPALDTLGNINLVVQYSNLALQTFALNIASQAVFDPGSGFSVPPTTTLTYDLDMSAAVRPVLSAADYNYTGPFGPGWVFASNPNDNKILAGNGGVTVYGGLGKDDVLTGSGNDLIAGGRGDDSLDGGAGSDTADFSDAPGAVSVDLLVTAGGYSAAALGAGETDYLKNIENIVGGVANDTLLGNDADNGFVGGLGDDFLSGRLGNDLLDGGAGRNTADYSYSAVGVTVDLDAGTSSGAAGDADTLSSIQNALGSAHDDTFVSSSVDNAFDGGAGVNAISYDGAAGAVTVDLAVGMAAGDGNDTLANIQNIRGSDFGDSLYGDSNNNTIWGGLGSDAMDGRGGSNQLRFDDLTTGGVTVNLGAGTAGYAADGSIDSFVNFQTYYLTNQADTLTGSAGDDTAYMLNGNDVFYASAGNDYTDGGAGTDTASFLSALSSVTASLTTGMATGIGVQTLVSFENLSGGAYNDVLTGDAAVNAIIGDAGDDTIYGMDGNDVLDGGLDNDTLYGGNGSDLISGGDGNDAVYGEAGNDTLFGSAGVDTLYGGDGSDSIDGGDNDDMIDAGAGNDTVYGGNGNDTMSGGADTNSIYGGNGDDRLQGGTGTDYFDGEGGINIIDYSVNYGYLYGDMRFPDGAGYWQLYDDYGVDYIKNVSVIYGGYYYNEFYFNNAGVTFYSTSGSSQDYIFGGSGADYIEILDNAGYGYWYNEQIQGGGGDDTIRIDAAGVGTAYYTYLYGDDGNDTILVGGQVYYSYFYGGLGVDTITAAQSQYSYFYGGSGDDAIIGGFYSYAINGEDGNDTLSGYEYSTIRGGNGNDTVTALGTYGTANLYGDAGNDTLNGSNLATDYLRGGDGDDTVNGNGGNDIIYIEGTTFGNDTINGGADNDTISVTAAGVTLRADLGYLTYSTYTVNFSQVEIFQLSAQDDTVYTSGGNDSINGGSGINYFFGSAGSDVLSGSGTETIDYSLLGAGVTVNLSTSSATVGGVGQTLSGFDHITGSGFADTLTGNTGANTIQGGGGDDIMVGQTGNDTMDGGAGNNTADYSYTATGLAVNMGSVALGNYYSVTVGAEVDQVRNIQTFIGGGGNDTITGDSLGNILSGGNGNDIIDGSTGNDTLDGQVGIDTVTYTTRTGITGISVDMGALVGGYATVTVLGIGEADLIAGFENINGSTFDDAITGDGNGNVINGIEGNDTIYGGLGNDTIDGGLGNDTLDGQGGTGDTITFASASAFVTASLLTGTAVGTGSGTDSIAGFENIIGSIYDDFLTGDNDAMNPNTISGGLGNDNIDGGAGNDTLNGDGGNDVIDGGAGSDFINGGAGFDIVNYASSTGFINVNLQTGAVSDGLGGMDTLTVNTVEEVAGSAYDDIFRDGTIGETIRGKAGNDTFTDFDSSGSDVLYGDTGTDTVDYSASAGSIIGNIQASGTQTFGTIQKAVDGTSDSLVSIERIYSGGSADNFTLDTHSLVVLTNLNTNGGNDRIRINDNSGLNLSSDGIDGITMAGVFQNIETLDLRGATLTGPDVFTLQGSNLAPMVGSSHNLLLQVKQGFALDIIDNLTVVSGSSAAAENTSTIGSVNSVTWDSGFGYNVTLQVETVA